MCELSYVIRLSDMSCSTCGVGVGPLSASPGCAALLPPRESCYTCQGVGYPKDMYKWSARQSHSLHFLLPTHKRPSHECFIYALLPLPAPAPAPSRHGHAMGHAPTATPVAARPLIVGSLVLHLLVDFGCLSKDCLSLLVYATACSGSLVL